MWQAYNIISSALSNQVKTFQLLSDKDNQIDTLRQRQSD